MYVCVMYACSVLCVQICVWACVRNVCANLSRRDNDISRLAGNMRSGFESEIGSGGRVVDISVRARVGM